MGDSKLLSVTPGIPQGSIMGPLLLIVNTAEILNEIKTCSYSGYADTYEYHIADYIANGELSRVAAIFKNQNVKFKPKKCTLMLFGIRQPPK